MRRKFATSLGGSGVEKQRIFGVGAGYDFGIVQATLAYTNVLFDYLDTSGLRLQNAELSLTRHITPMSPHWRSVHLYDG